MTSSPSRMRPPTAGGTAGSTAGTTRREDILRAAARLFAERGYRGVGVDEIGAAVGITGPGLYRHFRGKRAMLADLLLDISRRLLSEGRHRVEHAASPDDALDSLIRWHVGFALDSPDLITLHGRELAHLSVRDRREVRHLQRQYVELWVAVVGKVRPERLGPPAGPEAEAMVRASVHAVFGLINSTPYSAPAATRGADDRTPAGTSATAAGPSTGDAAEPPTADTRPAQTLDRTGMEDLLHRLAHGAFAAI